MQQDAQRAAQDERRRSARTWAFVGALALAAGVVTAAVAAEGDGPPATAPLWVVPLLALLVAAAEVLVVRIRLGRDVNGLNLVEAVLAPLLFACTAPQVVLAVASGQALAQAVQRNRPLKASFNVAQWSLAAACGSAVVAAVGGSGLSARALGAVVLALTVVELVNAAAFSTVLRLSTGASPRQQVLSSVAAQAAVNAAIGLLYVLALAASAAAVPLFVVPLVLLHLAHRGQTAARQDRARIAGLQRAAAAVAAPLEPQDGVVPFLEEVGGTFDARLALLRVDRPDGPLTAVARRTDDGGWAHGTDAADADGLLRALRHTGGPVRASATAGPHAAAVRAARATDVLAAPLTEGDRSTGVLVVVDRGGVDRSAAADLAVVAAMAREASGAFAKGRLLAQALEERRKLDQVVQTTSDGILSLDADGVVRSWNAACERLTGLPAEVVVGRPGALAALRVRTPDGTPAAIGGWARGAPLPPELVVDGADGPRRVQCSYARSHDDGPPALVVVARDVTPVEEMERLREDFARLVQAEAAQRVVVEHLQQAVMPPLPAVPGAELGVSYVASDPSSPTGGDLYDCLLLPTGELHLAVVDVLGHGTHATQDALAVVHALRGAVLGGVPFDQVVARADALVGGSHPDLVATVVLGRYEPVSGRLLVATGGHPPALVVPAAGPAVHLEPGGCAIGWPAAGADEVQEVHLSPGDAVVLYTDGLVESRKDVVAGMDALAGSATRLARRPAASLAEQLVQEALAGAERRDDTLALVLRRTAEVGPPAQPTAVEGAVT